MSDPRLRVIQHGTGSDEEAILAILDGTTIRVRMPASQPQWRHQLLGLVLVDLLGRVFSRIEVVLDAEAEADPRLPGDQFSLAERFAELRAHGTPALEPQHPTITLGVGPGQEADLHADGAAWISYLGTEPSRLDADDRSLVPIGALLAGARLAAHTFSRLMAPLGVPDQTPSSIYSSGLDFSYSTEPLPVQVLPERFALEAVQIGAGSIGGAFDYALARTGEVAGELEIVDPQTLEAENAYRAILAPLPLAEAHAEKQRVAAAALEGSGLDASGFHGDVRAWLATRARQQPLPLIVCAVDSIASRREIQDCLPRDLINAACNEREVTVSAHRTGLGSCVCCLHMPKLLNTRGIRVRRIEEATGYPYETVMGLLIGHAPLEQNHLSEIERHNGMPQGALRDFLGATLEQLYEAKLRYGAIGVETADGGLVSVASPWVTALAGFLLAAETLKHFGEEAYAPFRLGHGGELATKLEEGAYGSPEHRFLTTPPRWPDHCLCRSARRSRLLIERYGLAPDEFEL